MGRGGESISDRTRENNLRNTQKPVKMQLNFLFEQGQCPIKNLLFELIAIAKIFISCYNKRTF